MFSKFKKSQSEGFTIIEVMIVLAIAALILLIVLLAVPALQRNSRNTAIKNDAGNVAAGINEYKSNNDGGSPTGVAGTGTVVISGAGTSTNAKVQGNTVVNNAGNTSPAIGTISVALNKRCDNSTNTRAAAVWYSIENSSGTPQYKCADA